MWKTATVVGYAGAVLVGGVVVAVLAKPSTLKLPWSTTTPWDRMPVSVSHLDHSKLITRPLESGPEATRLCLSCHPDAASGMMKTSHWTWAGQNVKLSDHGTEDRDAGDHQILAIGKKNVINNFCIHAGPNLAKCVSCHVGYGWTDDTFDFSNEEHVDCLVCHDQTGTYRKDLAGLPAEGVDLVAVAQSVGRPTRTNCGTCHFKGGGGNAVKHGDLDGSMYHPSQRIDVHMGKLDFDCIDCHRTSDHQIAGLGMAVGIDETRRIACVDCHNEKPHDHERLDAHTVAVACQTCHIPRMAIDTATKMYWDWSEAGQEGREEHPRFYQKKKGSFQYAKNVAPEYYWFNGRGRRYLAGDQVDPNTTIELNPPLGERGEAGSKLWPFKVHRGKQVYDKHYLHLLTPQTWGAEGYWTTFDWDGACRAGALATGVPYSGEYAFAETAMYWPLSHMVQPKENALQCVDCHGDSGLLDWPSLGYSGDPAFGNEATAATPRSGTASVTRPLHQLSETRSGGN